MSHDRTTDGRFDESVSDREIVWFFETGDRPFHSAGEVADEFGLSRQQAHRRLNALVDAGDLQRIDFGSRSTAWWKSRDVVVLVEETDGYSAHDLTIGVASDGATRAEALQNVAEAIKARQGDFDMSADEVSEELGLDPADVDEDASPPF